MKVKLGVQARDVITGFKGTVTGICHYLSGCHQALVVPPVTRDGSFKGGEWFDLQRLEVTNAEKVVLNNDKTPGFDKEAPKR